MSGECDKCGEHALECKCMRKPTAKIKTAHNKNVRIVKKTADIKDESPPSEDSRSLYLKMTSGINPELLVPNPNEKVNHPSHYQGHKFEVIDIIEDFDLGFNLGNAIKYILRAGKKELFIEDIKKAIWYLQRELNHPS